MKEKPSNEISRLIAAFGHAGAGIRAACAHPAFRTELIAIAVLSPVALLVAQNGVQRALLIGSLLLVLMVELLNTGIEAAIDRVSTEWHPLSKLAKDCGSGAVLVSLVNAGIIWLSIVF